MIKCFGFRSLLVLTALVATAAAPSAQESKNGKRIQLKSGGPALVLEGEVRKDKDSVYVFSAKAGQKFTGRITRKDGNTGFAVTDPNGEPLPEEENDFNTTLKGSLKKTGDYKITVSTFENRESKYTLVIRIN
jgi:hypothetical protein